MNDKISRRTLLRGLAATACCSGMPGLLLAQEVPEGAKLSKELAQYQPKPNGDKSCANCLQFIAESNSCRIVQGEVAPDGYCKLWAAAKN